MTLLWTCLIEGVIIEDAVINWCRLDKRRNLSLLQRNI